MTNRASSKFILKKQQFYMELSTATGLIRNGVQARSNQRWADLGAGSGLFTRALAGLLQEGQILAVDKDSKALTEIPDVVGAVKISKRVGDFANPVTIDAGLDGIVMANALHFIENKASLLQVLKQKLKPGGRIVIIEYDLEKGNAWVPYPVSFKKLEELMLPAKVKKLAETSSVYQRANIYSALVLY